MKEKGERGHVKLNKKITKNWREFMSGRLLGVEEAEVLMESKHRQLIIY